MFIENKWYKIYQQILINAKSRGLDKTSINYKTERHHIVPRSMNGTDDEDNLVLLTLKEHFVCHHLLTKCTSGAYVYKMKHAYAQMVHCGKFSPTARQYELARQIYSEGKRSKQWRMNISKAAIGRKKTPEQVEAMKKRLTGRKLSESHKRNIAIASKKRGVPEQCRAARLKTLVKHFSVTYPDGKKHEGTNLKQFCLDNEIHYPTASNNSKTEKPVSRGPLKGYNLKINC